MTEAAGGQPSAGRLAWRCRRGMKELDLLLRGWLERRHPHATPGQRAAFEALLELPDPEIAGLLLGRETATDPTLAALVQELRPAVR